MPERQLKFVILNTRKNFDKILEAIVINIVVISLQSAVVFAIVL